MSREEAVEGQARGMLSAVVDDEVEERRTCGRTSTDRRISPLDALDELPYGRSCPLCEPVPKGCLCWSGQEAEQEQGTSVAGGMGLSFSRQLETHRLSADGILG